ncbi:hypothetical protein [Clostridium tagluense]|nr:hypothetical protein [Clostridium tagluense]
MLQKNVHINDYYLRPYVACPEAARILLLKEEGIEFTESYEPL